MGDHYVDISNFYIRRYKNGTEALQNGCKDCRKKYRDKHYAENREYYIQKARRNNNKTVELIRELKRGKPCENCGHVGHPAAMHWHHIDSEQKEFNISEARYVGRARILKEVAKCKLLCADCHAELTWGAAI